MRSRGAVAVAGATGRVGRHVVDLLEAGEHEVVPISRSSGVDLVSGEGLADALAGVATIVDVATHDSADEQAATAFFTAATRNLQEAGERGGVEQIVLLSIIGIDRFTTGYYAAKRKQEQAMLSGRIRVRILRASQFHEYIPEIIGRFRQDEAACVPRWPTQPVAARCVAEALVDLAVGPDPARESAAPPFPEIAGPQAENLAGLAQLLCARLGDPERVEVVPDTPIPESDVYASGGLLPGPAATLAGPTFERWLSSAGCARTLGPRRP